MLYNVMKEEAITRGLQKYYCLFISSLGRNSVGVWKHQEDRDTGTTSVLTRNFLATFCHTQEAVWHFFRISTAAGHSQAFSGPLDISVSSCVYIYIYVYI